MPHVLVYQKDGSVKRLNNHTPFALGMASLAHRDLNAIWKQVSVPKLVMEGTEGEGGGQIVIRYPTDWIRRFTFAVSRETGKVSPMDWWSRPYQPQIINDPSHRICIQKSTQIGLSETCLRKLLWFLMTHDGTTAMMTLPDENLANNFSDTRIGPVIEASPLLSEALGNKTDSYGRKNLGRSWLLVISSWAKRSAQSTPVDFLVVDEEDFSMPNVRISLNERLSSSPHDYAMDISIPMAKGKGINRVYLDSTQNNWLVVCPKCSGIKVKFEEIKDVVEFQQYLHDLPDAKRNYLTLDHIKPVNKVEYDYFCEHCNKPLDRRYGHWQYDLAEIDKKTHGGAVSVWSGYKVNQLAAPFISATNIMAKKSDYERGIFGEGEGIADFQSHVIGEPPGEAAGIVLPTSGDIGKLFLRYNAPMGDDSGQCSMGVDWGQKDSWGIISKPIEFVNEGIYRVILAMIHIEGGDVDSHAKRMLHFARAFQVGACFADYGFGAHQNSILWRGLGERFWAVVSASASPQQVITRAKDIQKPRYDFGNHQVHVFIDFVIRRHVRGIMNISFYSYRQPYQVYDFFMKHHDALTLKKQTMGADGFIGFDKSGPNHFVLASCYDLLAYDYLRKQEEIVDQEEVKARRLAYSGENYYEDEDITPQLEKGNTW